ncbi:MAG TPA: hypothetical protein PLS90_03340 [Candidatus Sumerlaeota bacterium]|nr:hypothetical protein [Candidatus Sumerlaeota bacterium]HOR29563.1 hypothetical protein [Candidatus Sumerlaeota bacterium]HPK01470.1 hypothetical protein [Candidatus Sumerlaeota bacterium]
MIGVHDFCGHYDWTFEYLRRLGGEELVARYWREAIGFDSQRHALQLFLAKGIEGMAEYWGHTLTLEEAGYRLSRNQDVFRLDMHACPSKGYLIEHGLEAYPDYCTHCIGWIGPVAEQAGFQVDHEHNHCGQCWWELHRNAGEEARRDVREQAGADNVEHHPRWPMGTHHRFRNGKPES